MPLVHSKILNHLAQRYRVRHVASRVCIATHHVANVVTPISPLLFQPATPATRSRIVLNGNSSVLLTWPRYAGAHARLHSARPTVTELTPSWIRGRAMFRLHWEPAQRHSSHLLLRVLCSYPAPRVLILRRASYDASYPAPPRPILHRRFLSCAVAS